MHHMVCLCVCAHNMHNMMFWAAGLLDVENRLAVATRYGQVVLLRNGIITNTIHLDVSSSSMSKLHMRYCTFATQVPE